MRTSAPIQHNYFVAARPDPIATARIGELVRGLARTWAGGGRPMDPRRYHVSLKSIGVDDRPMIDWTARAAAAARRVRFPAFRLEFNRIAAFGGGGDGKALVLRGDEGVIGADLLREAVHGALADAGLTRRRQRPFEAHLTLVRGACDGPELLIPPVSWTVREFVLIHSLAGRTRYEIVGRFPLSG